MGYCCRGFLAFLLSVLNFFQTFLGVALILYSNWMLNQWNSQHSGMLPYKIPGHGILGSARSFYASALPAPWFIYGCLGFGIAVTVISCCGHIGAETRNGCCLCIYTTLMVFLILLEAAVVADIFFNPHWKDDIPDDPTGELDSITKTIKDGLNTFKWIGLSVLIMQILSLLLAKIIWSMHQSSSTDYDSDDDYFIPLHTERQNPWRTDNVFVPVLPEKRSNYNDPWNERFVR